MEYYYEVNISEIGKKNAKELYNRLRKLNYNVLETEKQLIIRSEEYYDLYRIEKVVQSIKAGFSVKDSIKILTNDHELLSLDIKKIAEGKSNHISRIKARIIGEHGKAIKSIEDLTKAKIIVGDREVYILGDRISAQAAYEGIKKLAGGTPHNRVYDHVSSMKRHLKNKEKEASYYLDLR